MSTKKSFVETVKKKLETLKREVERLQSNAARIDNLDIAEYTATIQDLLAKIQQMEKEFTDSKPNHADTWQELRKHTEAFFVDLESSVKAAKRKYLS